MVNNATEGGCRLGPPLAVAEPRTHPERHQAEAEQHDDEGPQRPMRRRSWVVLGCDLHREQAHEKPL